MENWKQIDGGVYEVSDLGRVRNATSGRVLKTYTLPRGYVALKLGGQHAYVHRLVATAFLGAPATGREVNHRDGNKANNAAVNLEWATHSENQRHAHRVLGSLRLNLPSQIGEANTHAKLTNANVREIRSLLQEGSRQRAIATRFGVSQSVVSDIANGKRWRHVA